DVAIECMKLDGTIAKMHGTWFGVAPAAGSAPGKGFSGYGGPDMPGYDPTAHNPPCSSKKPRGGLSPAAGEGRLAMTTGAPPILEIRGLRKRFHDVEVLRGIDLVVLPQQLVFVIGPSGSGKSTLLRCCNRLEEASAGSIRVDGVDITARSTDI